jgi:MFS family permease
MVSPSAIRRLRSHRRWVVMCAFVQALSFAGFVVAALLGAMPDAIVFAIATVYWGAGMATGPAWNTWVGSLVPRRMRARFFASRSRLAQAAVLFGLVVGGVALEWGKGRGDVLLVFAVLFALAGIFRAVSAACLASQSEPRPMPPNHRDVSIAELVRRARHGRDGRLLVYMLAVQLAVQLSGPFFTPYMLAQLRFSYIDYLLLIGTAFVAKMVALPMLGAMSHRFGSERLLYAAGVGIIPMSALWIVSDSLPYLLCVQVVSGCVWAGYELATFLLLFEHIDEGERTSVLTLFNFANAVALVGGALIGGSLLHAIGTSRESYWILFGLSTVARVVSLVFLFRIEHVRFAPATLAVRALGVRANTGSLDAPIVSSLVEDDEPVAPELGGP